MDETELVPPTSAGVSLVSESLGLISWGREANSAFLARLRGTWTD